MGEWERQYTRLGAPVRTTNHPVRIPSRCRSRLYASRNADRARRQIADRDRRRVPTLITVNSASQPAETASASNSRAS
eukprot:535865-Prymnesium_polylepis.1